MPQLDQVSFLSQLSWLIIFYFGFHLILVDNFLPKISTIIKLRNQQILNSPLVEEKTKSGESHPLEVYHSILVQSILESGKSLVKGISQKAEWMDSLVKKFNSTTWKNLNSGFLKSLLTTKVGQDLVFKNLFQIWPSGVQAPSSEKTSHSFKSQLAEDFLFKIHIPTPAPATKKVPQLPKGKKS